MTKIFEEVKPGDLITSDLFNKMAAKIEELDDRINTIMRTNSGTIAGTVVDREKNLPVVGARVYAISGNVTVTSDPTDSSGNYTLPNLLPGTYRVWVDSENYARSKVETVNVVAAATSTVSFTLTSAVNMVEVPDVQGASLSQALAEISDKGLKAGLILDTNSNVIDPTNPASASLIVINQSLSPGDPVPAGTTINLFLAVHAAEALPPLILGLVPNTGKVGDTVEINGIGFGSQKGRVTFSGIEATDITDWMGDNIKVKVPTGAVSGDVQVTNADGVKSNTYNFIISGIPCTTSCMTGSCTSSCTTSTCQTACMTSRIACIRCETGSIVCARCETGSVVCAISVTGGFDPCSFKSQVSIGSLGTGGCGAASLISDILHPGDIYVNPGTVLTKGDTVKVFDKGNPVEGTIKEADIMIEEGGKAIIPSGTDSVKITTPTGEVTGPAISSTGIGVDPGATVITIKDADGKEYGGTIVSAKGRYEAGTGITLNSGTEATVKVGNKLVTGAITDKTVIGTGSLDIGRGMMRKLGP